MSWQLNLDASKVQVCDPLGYRCTATDPEETRKQQRDLKNLRAKKAADVAKGSAGGMFQTFLMLFMSGSSLNIFSIIITGMAMWNPIKALLSFNSAFAPYESDGVSLLGPKAMYLGLNFVILLAGLYKFSIMGLVPVLAEDWISLVPIMSPLEEAYNLNKI